MSAANEITAPANDSQITIAGTTYVVEGSIVEPAGSNINKFRADRGWTTIAFNIAVRKPRGSKSWMVSMFANGEYGAMIAL